MKRLLISLFLLASCLLSGNNGTKKELTIDEVVKWKRITESIISDDGMYSAFKFEPWRGVATIKLYNREGGELFAADSASNMTFIPGSEILSYKRGDTKSESLHIYNVKKGVEDKIESVKKYLIGEKWGEAAIIVLQRDSSLLFQSVKSSRREVLGKATDVKIAEEREVLFFVNDKALLTYRMGAERADTLFKGEKKIDNFVADKRGDGVAFVSDNKLFIWRGDQVEEIASNVSGRRAPYYSDNGNKIYYGVMPEKRTRDTTYAKDEFPEVHIWHWKEEVQFAQQVINKQRDMNASYLAVYDVNKGVSSMLTDDMIPDVRTIDKGNSDYYIGVSNRPYALESMWEGRGKSDIWLIDVGTNSRKLIAEGVAGSPRISPEGRYLYWYSSPDSAWFTASIPAFEVVKVTDPKILRAYDEDNDVPDWPSSYSSAGWSSGDEYFLVYDKYDIWRVDPKGAATPVRLTPNGRESGMTYRYVAMDRENREVVDLKGDVWLMGFDNTSKGNSLYRIKLNGKDKAVKVYGDDFQINNFIKAKNSDYYLFTRESFEEFPNYYLTDSKFKKPIKLTEANPQQRDFNWGSAELISWVSSDGIRLEGVLYKPENFDPAKKYPMIVNFYEKNSSSLYSHRIPEAHRSTIDYHMYTSQGYIVFNPDVVYTDGFPGESAYNAVMPGIAKIIEMGFVDPHRIGAQGHSWGGYQVAYLATRTNLFAAIESGAPVVNMFSAYGGIRWGTGINRSFQYEYGQSRIGETPWEAPFKYIENSPLFTMDKVTTPILIMQNDQDGHVPWYQGIEYFVALKRLQKPVWMLNYSGEVHWPQKMKNKIDFQIRMMQFFDHYLKGKPMPRWMDEGLTLIDLEYELGYELKQ